MTSLKQFLNIASAHRVAKKSIVIWGSSGFGKSSMVKQYCRDNGLHLVEKRACYIDILDLKIPEKQDGYFDHVYVKWLRDLCTTTVPTALFLDEMSRANPQVFAMFTELLLDRKIDGMPISDCVQIIGATNWSEEDTGVIEFPNAVMNRPTHLIWAPDTFEVSQNMQSAIMKKVAKDSPEIFRAPAIEKLNVDNCPRQGDDVGFLWETGMLSEDELYIVARGRMGIEAGNACAAKIIAITKNEKQLLPSKVNPKTFDQIHEVEMDGKINEVMNLLRTVAEKGKPADKKNVADYLIFYARPELCRAMKEAKFDHMIEVGSGSDTINHPVTGEPLKHIITGEVVHPPVTNGKMPWIVPCAIAGKISVVHKQ